MISLVESLTRISQKTAIQNICSSIAKGYLPDAITFTTGNYETYTLEVTGEEAVLYDRNEQVVWSSHENKLIEELKTKMNIHPRQW